jgi:hypothetical protein
LAQQLETAIHSNGDIDASLEAVDRELTRFLADLNAVLPAEVLPDEPAESEAVDLDIVPELVAALEKQTGVWEQLSETLSINDVEHFANELKALGEQYRYARLVKWGEGLAYQTSMFDLEKMVILLKEYPNLVADLKTLEST